MGVIIVPSGFKNPDFVPLRVFESKITTVRVTMIPFRVLTLGRTRGRGGE